MADLIDKIKSLYQKDKDTWHQIYATAEEDLYFLAGEDDSQWSELALSSRRKKGRPALTINQLIQYVNQVVNDIRANTPTVKIIPSTDGDKEVADIYEQIIRNIFYVSNADTCFDTAASYQVRGSYGFIEVDHRYIDNKSFNQELVIQPVNDPSVYILDSDSVNIDGSDAKHYFKVLKISTDEFESKYKNAAKDSFCFDNHYKDPDDDNITLLQFCEIVEDQITLGLKSDGTVETVAEGVDYIKTRTSSKKSIKKYIISDSAILEETDFVGEFLPLVPVYGTQYWVNGKRYIDSLIRHSKDAQRMFNLWKSLETELLLKQPNAPYVVAEGTTENYDELWKDPASASRLIYKATDFAGNPVPPPRREEPPMIPAGIVNAARSAIDDIKATIGMYGAALGERTNEVSGVAIQSRATEGSMVNYHFMDNLTKSITQVTKVLVGAIPYIYDTPRVLRAIDAEEKPKEIGVNGMITDGQKRTYDLTQGSYDVRVVQGASYTTQRQEAAEFFNRVVVSNPDLMMVMGDLLFKYMDFAGAQAMAKRMERFVDPKFKLADESEEKYDAEKEQLKLVIQEGEKLMEQLQAQNNDLIAQLDNKKVENDIKLLSERTKIEAEANDTMIDSSKIELENRKAQMDYDIKMLALELKKKELELRELDKQRELRLRYEELEAETVERMAKTMSSKVNIEIEKTED